jgi:ribosome maturation protein SDO1
MTQTIARIKREGKHFEIVVDMEAALDFKKGKGSVSEFLLTETIFTDSKKGNVASQKELQECFQTTDSNAIAEKIVKNGEVLVTQEKRDEDQERRIKQVIDFLVTNTINPQNGHPHTAERIKNAINESHIHIKNVPIENQIPEIMSAISSKLPIKIETRKVKIIVPAVHTGKAYGLVTQYKETENWLNDGSLEVIANIPSGLIMEFYDKLNSMTHGSVITEEVKQ